MKIIFFSILLLGSVTVFAQDYTIENNEVKINRTVQFETGTDHLTKEGKAALEIIKKYLDDKTYISLLRIECHTDNSGSEQANQSLSEKRALAISKALVEMGADCKRLIAVGFGSSKPVAANDTVEGRAANRRVVFFNAALRGRLIGGMPADGGGKVAGDSCAQ
ncbi:MAG: OmpA family protein [Bacteroidetes bacterium]|nr:OmpA family protein [Bacteroidota bacterium]